jgi:hypothetical protein
VLYRPKLTYTYLAHLPVRRSDRIAQRTGEHVSEDRAMQQLVGDDGGDDDDFYFDEGFGEGDDDD